MNSSRLFYLFLGLSQVVLLASMWAGSNEPNALIMKQPISALHFEQRLSEADMLWPKFPKECLSSLSESARALNGLKNIPEAQQVAATLFTNLMNKPIPTQPSNAIACVRLKGNAINSCLAFDNIRTNSARWVEIAKHIGEIRDLIIPNYHSKGLINAPTTLGDPPEKAQEIIEKNRANIQMDALQNVLQSENINFTRLLAEQCYLFSRHQSSTNKFIEQIVSAAHMSKEEILTIVQPKR